MYSDFTLIPISHGWLSFNRGRYSVEYFKELTWLKFADRCNYHTAVLIYKTMKNMIPSYMTDIHFSENKTHKLRSISNKDLVLKDITRTNCMKNSFAYYSKSIWNDIPCDIRASLSVKTLEEKYKNVYCSLYFYLFKLYITINYHETFIQ